MDNFKYVHLPDLYEDDVMRAFPEWGEQFTHEAFVEWYHSYSRFASICYRAQYQHHWDIVWSAFCKEYGWPIDDPLDSYQREVFNAYAEPRGLLRHEWNYQAAESRLEQTDDMLDPNRPIIYDMRQAYERLIRRMESTVVHPDDHIIQFQLYGLWFNTIVGNSPDTAAELRRMPYDEYLKTDHWRRVRTAMLIAHRGRCQGNICWQMDSYWFDEKWLHVHHMTYKNRGNERYADLRLVCKECHEHIHEGKTGIFPDHLAGYYEVLK